MKKIFCFLAVIIVIFSLCSCNNAEKILNAGTKSQGTSDVADKNLTVTLPPVSAEKVLSKGRRFQDPDKSDESDYELSYVIKESAVLNSLSQLNISAENLHLFEYYCHNNGEMKKDYSFLVITAEVYCTRKSLTAEHNPYCPSISVGKILQSGDFQSITGEVNLFSCNGIINKSEKDYYQYEINEGEKKLLKIGWFIPSKEAESLLVAQIGHTSIGSNGDVYDNSVYVNLGD